MYWRVVSMYGIVESLGKESSDRVVEYIVEHYKELERFSAGLLKNNGHDVNMAVDLLNDTYLVLDSNRYDRDEVLSAEDAGNIVREYLSKAAKHDKYKGRCTRHGDTEFVSIYNEDGSAIDIECAENTEDEADIDDYDYKLALRFMGDTLEPGADRVANVITTLTSIIKAMETMSDSERAATEIAVRSMKFDNASEDFKEAFRVLLHKSIMA